MTRWMLLMASIGVFVSCAREDGLGKTATGIARGDQPAADSGAALAMPPAMHVDGSATWLLSECYETRDEVFKQRRDAVQQLAQCSDDSDCERAFSVEWASCWGPQCSPAMFYRGSSAFERDVRQLHDSAAFSEACEAVVEMGCEFPPSSCPTTLAPTDPPPLYTCVAGVCEPE
jgi:hypothetical protein